MSINFHTEDTDYNLDNKRSIQKWITFVINDQEHSLGTINYILCSDEYLLAMNQKYLNHDTYTDVITFDYSTPKVISGDIFISIERVHENARLFKKTLIDELSRVMVHGVLHLCGYKDKSLDESAEMRKMEDHYLAFVH
ncbi:MAG: rRNA maturation RNase YbeY [Lentimicrobiaceae bacterium]